MAETINKDDVKSENRTRKKSEGTQTSKTTTKKTTTKEKNEKVVDALVVDALNEKKVATKTTKKSSDDSIKKDETTKKPKTSSKTDVKKSQDKVKEELESSKAVSSSKKTKSSKIAENSKSASSSKVKATENSKTIDKSDINNSKNESKNEDKNEDKTEDENEEVGYVISRRKNSNKTSGNKFGDDEKVTKSFDDKVSLDEIRETLGNNVTKDQKRKILKENIINIFIAILIILYLLIVFAGSKNMSAEVLEVDLKVLSISIAVIGLVILEVAYKKDNSKIAFNGGELLVFGATNLCIMYIIKLYPLNLLNTITGVSIVIMAYYLAKIIFLSIRNVKKYKKDNNDIKEIIKK